MKQSINKLFIIIFMVFSYIAFIPICKADECDTNRLKELAKMVDVSVEFNYKALELGAYTNNVISVTGLTEEFYVLSDDGAYGFYYSEVVDGAVKHNVDASDIDELEVYSVCSKEVLRRIKLNLKKYNTYSEIAECEGLKDVIDVCSEFYDGNENYEQIVKKINDYKANKGKDNNDDDESKFNFDWKYINVGLAFVFVIFCIVYFIYKNKKDRLD